VWGRQVNRHKVPYSMILVALLASQTPAYAQEMLPESAQPAPETVTVDTASEPQWNVQPQHNMYASQPVRAVPPDPGRPVAGAAVLPNYVEAGINYSSVSRNQGDWFGQGIRGEIQTDPNNRWKAEYLHQRQFKDSGHYFSIGNVHSFNPDWYSDISVGTSTGGFFFPTYRVDAFLNKKWLEKRNFLTTIGYGHFQSRDIYADDSLYFGTTYYFHPYWIFENGVRFNLSSPGSVTSASGFVALTNGRVSNYFVTVRYGYGREAYQLIGPGNLLSDFYSHNMALIWRQWMLKDWGYDNDWGFNTRIEYYTNPNYHRLGTYLGVFKEF
jgi:YaiO family outer membrane protein